MCNDFRVLPIPAYDIDSKLIHPTQYARALKDAVVAIHFTLKHWGINDCDTDIADIINIRILVPLPQPLTPRRRKIALTDPFDPKRLKKNHLKST